MLSTEKKVEGIGYHEGGVRPIGSAETRVLKSQTIDELAETVALLNAGPNIGCILELLQKRQQIQQLTVAFVFKPTVDRDTVVNLEVESAKPISACTLPHMEQMR